MPVQRISEEVELTAKIVNDALVRSFQNIGGFDIGVDYIRDVANSFGFSAVVTGGDDVRLWAGDSFANRATAPFRLTEAGVMTATAGTIGGCTFNTNYLSSATFVSGPLGSGWRMMSNGSTELQDVTVRGIIRTSVFEKDTISAVNGMVLISSSDVLASDMTALDSSTLVITGETTFSANEVIRIKDGTNDEWLLVTSAASAPTYTVTRDLAGSYAPNTNPIWKKGTAVVSTGVGTGTTTGYILLDSSSTNSPYIDIYKRNSNTYTDTTLKARLGWLKGIVDADVGLSSTDVWGLYSDNVYLKGTIVASSGYIGGTTGWVITSNNIKDAAGVVGLSSTVTGGDDIRFWAGHATPASAPFYVTESGALVATSATISGAITATTGSIGGFDVGSDYIRDTANSFGLASTVTGGIDVRFWAGDTFANRASAPFYVREDGSVFSRFLTILGTGSVAGYITLTEGTAPTGGADGKVYITSTGFFARGTWGTFKGNQDVSTTGTPNFTSIGATTPGTGAFTTLSASADASITGTVGIGSLPGSYGIIIKKGSGLATIALQDSSNSDKEWRIASQDSGAFKIIESGVSERAVFSSTGLAVTGVISTTDPAGGAGPNWKLGVAASVSPTSPNRTLRVDIAGTSYYIAAKTTND